MKNTSYLIDVAFQALDESRFGRFKFCVEELLEKLRIPSPVYAEDPRFGLLLLVEKSMLSKSEHRFKELSMSVLRKLRNDTEGNLKVVSESLLSLFLGCQSCHIRTERERRRIEQEQDGLPDRDNLRADDESFLALWYWYRYWYQRYQTPCSFYIFLERLFIEEVRSDFPELDEILIANAPAEFFRAHQPIQDISLRRRLFKKYFSEYTT